MEFILAACPRHAQLCSFASCNLHVYLCPYLCLLLDCHSSRAEKVTRLCPFPGPSTRPEAGRDCCSKKLKAREQASVSDGGELVVGNCRARLEIKPRLDPVGHGEGSVFNSKGKRKPTKAFEQGPDMLSCMYSITQSCLTLCNPVDCSPPSPSVQGLFQARILEQVAICYSRGSS